MKISTVTSIGRKIRTWDSPLNRWVKNLDDGKYVPVDQQPKPKR